MMTKDGDLARPGRASPGATMDDSFGEPLLAGLDFADALTERMLIARIGPTELTALHFQGSTGKRLTSLFGWQQHIAPPTRTRRSIASRHLATA